MAAGFVTVDLPHLLLEAVQVRKQVHKQVRKQ